MSEQFPTLDEMGPIPWQCWDVPGFKACHEEAGNVTYRELESVGAKAGTKEWNEVYPIVYRRNVRRCEVLSNCSQKLLEAQKPPTTSESDSEILRRLGEMKQQENTDYLKWLAAAVGVGVLFFVYKRMKA